MRCSSERRNLQGKQKHSRKTGGGNCCEEHVRKHARRTSYVSVHVRATGGEHAARGGRQIVLEPINWTRERQSLRSGSQKPEYPLTVRLPSPDRDEGRVRLTGEVPPAALLVLAW